MSNYCFSVLVLLRNCTSKVLKVENVITKHANGLRTQFTLCRLRTRGFGSLPLSSLEKIEAQEQSVKVIENSIYQNFILHTNLLGEEGAMTHKKRICLPSTSKLDWVIRRLTLSISPQYSASLNSCWCLRRC